MGESARQYAMVLAGGLAVIAVVAFVAVLPSRVKLDEAQGQLAALEAEIDRRQEQLGPLGRLTQRVGQLEEELRTGHKTLPEQADLGTFLGRISRIVEGQRLGDLEITPGQLIGGGGMFRMPMKLTFSGTLGGLFAVLRELEALPHYTRVEELKIENDSRYSGRLAVDLAISVFFSGQEAAS